MKPPTSTTRLIHVMTLTTFLLAITTPVMTAQARKEKEATSVAGTWSMTVKGTGAHGDMVGSLALKQDGSKVSGVLNAHGQDQSVSGEFVDGALALQTKDGDPAHQVALKASLKPDGTLAGYISGPMGDLRWTASRVKG